MVGKSPVLLGLLFAYDLLNRWLAVLAGRWPMVKLIRTEINYGTLRKECLEALRHWPGCETIAGIQLIRDNTEAGFSVKITLYGKADKRIADRALTYVEREKRRLFRLIA